LFFYINYDMIAKIDYSKFKDYILKAEQLFMKYKDDKDIVWRVAVSHRPMYCGESGKPDCLVNHYYFKAFDDIYRKYKVDVYLQSHEHLYERLKFINSWKFVTFPSNVTAGIVEYQDITEPLQMICGTGGSNETLIPNIPTYPIQDKQIGGIESYLDIKVNDTSFTILFKASRDQSLLDAVRLNKAAIRPVDLQDKKEPDSSSFMKSGLWLVLTVVMVLVVAAVVFYMIKNRQMQMKTYEKNPTSADTPAPPAKEYLMDEEKSRIEVSRADII
jgi:large-conductance mechanosensitive channel